MKRRVADEDDDGEDFDLDDILDLGEDEDEDEDEGADYDDDTDAVSELPEQPKPVVSSRPRLALPPTAVLEPFARESFDTEEVTTPLGLLFEIRQFTGGKPIAYDPCSSPWSPTRALHANMLKQYREMHMKLGTDPVQQGRFKHNFPGKITYGDGLGRPFPTEGLTWVFPGFKARRVQQWLQKVRSESLQHRTADDRPHPVQNGHELPWASETIMLVPLEHLAKPFFDYVWAADAVCFLRETLWFGGAEARSKTPSALVYYGYRRGRFRRSFAPIGRVMRRKDIRYTGPKKLTIFAPPAPVEERLSKPMKPKPVQKEKT